MGNFCPRAPKCQQWTGRTWWDLELPGLSPTTEDQRGRRLSGAAACTFAAFTSTGSSEVRMCSWMNDWNFIVGFNFLASFCRWRVMEEHSEGCHAVGWELPETPCMKRCFNSLETHFCLLTFTHYGCFIVQWDFWKLVRCHLLASVKSIHVIPWKKYW